MKNSKTYWKLEAQVWGWQLNRDMVGFLKDSGYDYVRGVLVMIIKRAVINKGSEA